MQIIANGLKDYDFMIYAFFYCVCKSNIKGSSPTN